MKEKRKEPRYDLLKALIRVPHGMRDPKEMTGKVEVRGIENVVYNPDRWVLRSNGRKK